MGRHLRHRLASLIFIPNYTIQVSYSQIRVSTDLKLFDCASKQYLAFVIWNIRAKCILYASVNMNIRFAPIGVSCHHEHIIYPGVTHSFY